MNTEQNGQSLLTEVQAAEFLNFTPRALQNWRITGQGPAFVKIGSRSVRYRLEALRDWIEARERQSTSEV